MPLGGQKRMAEVLTVTEHTSNRHLYSEGVAAVQMETTQHKAVSLSVG